jgi:O-antigen/teichoic acid export membrane protein
MKAKRSLLNLIIGLGSQIVTIILAIFIPRLLMLNFGSEGNGLVTSINQLIVYLTLLEAGVGAASLQALYKPVSEDDKDSINKIMAATSSYYKKTGIYYFFAVILLSIIYPFVIDSTIDKMTMAAVILLTGIGGALNYYYQGKYRILLTAEGKTYINTSIMTIINILINLGRIALLLLGFNLIAVQSTYFVFSLVQILIYYLYVKRNYKWINLKVKPNFDAISQKNAALVHQASWLIFSNTAVLILTLFTNLKVVSVYVLYNMLFSIIDNVINTVSTSITFLLGQTYHESKERFVKLYDAYEVYFMVITFTLFTVTYIMMLPFIDLYTAGINDIEYIDKWLPILFVSIKLLVYVRSSGNNAINIAGHFKKTQNRSIIESVINLVFSLLFVSLYGIYGVLLGTLMAVLYRSTDIIIYSNKNIIGRSPWVTIRRWLINVGVFSLIILIANFINIYPESYLSIILYAVLLAVVIFPIYFIIMSLFEREVYLYAKGYLVNWIRNRQAPEK